MLSSFLSLEPAFWYWSLLNLETLLVFCHSSQMKMWDSSYPLVPYIPRASPFSKAASFWGVILFLIFLLMPITGWGSIHTKVQRLWRYQQLRWLWRRRNPCLYNRKMWKRILWILGRKKIASSSQSLHAVEVEGGAEPCLSKQLPSSFIPATEVLITSSVCTCKLLCTKAPLRKHWPCHDTVCTTFLLLVVFSTLQHPSHNFSDQCSILFSGVSDGSVMAVCYLKESYVLLFVVWSDIFADQWLEDKL